MKRNNGLILLGSSCIIILIVTLYPTFVSQCISKDSTTRGTFGDMFGALNTLFSGLAFVAVVFTLIVQFEEIKENKKESERNRIKSEEEFKILKLTSEIEVLKSYMDGLDNNDKENEFREVTKKIIKKYTEKYFYLNENRFALEPEILIVQKIVDDLNKKIRLNIDNPQISQAFTNEILLITNNGASLDDFRLLIDDTQILYVDKFKKGSLEKIKMRVIKDGEIKLKYTAKSTNFIYKWEGEIKLLFNNYNISVEYGAFSGTIMNEFTV